MNRQKHDQFSKQCLAELLEPEGEIHINYEIQGVSRYVDIYFTPTTTARNDLGLLTQLTLGPCLLEPFRNQPTKMEVRQCMLKLFALQSELKRQAKRKKSSVPESALPRLWILSTSASELWLNFFEAKTDVRHWGEGICFLPKWTKTAIIVIDRLPTTPNTLWLRVLGKGQTQRDAIDEITALPRKDALRERLLELLFIWHIDIETKVKLTKDDKELLMNLTPAHQKYKDEILRQGLKKGQQVFVKNWLRAKFGKLDRALSKVVDPLVQLSPEESSRLLMRLSREELLAKFAKK
jgi:hypothetical protein